MRRSLLALALILAFPLLGRAVEVGVGFLAGARQVRDSRIREVYGNGTVWFPHLELHPWKGVLAGAGYEGGYVKDGVLGLYQESASFRVAGFELYAGYKLKIGLFSPYLRVGYGSYSYEQTVEGPVSDLFKVDGRKGAVVLAGGLHYSILDRIALAVEVKYVPLTVQPFEEKVDLGGIRYLIGLAYSFRL